MAFVFNLDTEAAAKNGGNGKLKSGVHDVEIKGIFLGQDGSGNNTIDIVVETAQGQKAVIFGMCIDKTWKTGSANVNYARWNELAMIAGIKLGTLAPQTRRMGGADTQADAFVEATGAKVKMAIQEHFDAYNNELKDTYQLVQTFGPEGHTVSEKMEGKVPTKFENFEVTPWYTPQYKVSLDAGLLRKKDQNGKLIPVSKDGVVTATTTDNTAEAPTPTPAIVAATPLF